jgi:solute carrier family 25 protein 38
VVKTRFESGHFQYNSVVQALRSIWRSEGRKGLFSGLSATLARDAPFSALYLLFYTQTKQAVSRAISEEPLPPMYNFPCGVFSGFMASVITQPFDVIKTRMQVKPQIYPTLHATLLTTLKDMGVRGLFTGIMPRATRRTLMAAFTWAFYEEIVQFVNGGLNR